MYDNVEIFMVMLLDVLQLKNVLDRDVFALVRL